MKFALKMSQDSTGSRWLEALMIPEISLLVYIYARDSS